MWPCVLAGFQKHKTRMCRIRNCIPHIVKKDIMTLLIKHQFFFPLPLSAHVLGLEECVRSTVMVWLAVPWSVSPISDFSNCQLRLWPLTTWPCSPYTVLSQLNADSCKISCRKLSPGWARERKSLKFRRKGRGKNLLLFKIQRREVDTFFYNNKLCARLVILAVVHVRRGKHLSL